jgi:DMSO reductase family type II enzyme chaperone
MTASEASVCPALDAVDHALCRSALWEALALGFRRPTDETLVRLASPEGATALAEAADALAGADLAACARALAGEPVPSRDALESAYDRLFGHTARGVVSPYETEYGDDSPFLPQREMSDIAAFLRAFGLVRRPEAHERLDHLACECEFMLVLTRKEAHALRAHEAAMLEETHRAGRLFLRDHLGRWAPAFSRNLAREGRGHFYGALGELCGRFVALECRRAGVPAGPQLLRLRSGETAEVPMACGPSAEACGP